MPPGILNSGSGFIDAGRLVPPASSLFIIEMRKVTSQSLHDLAAYCGAVLKGDGGVRVSGMASVESAKAGDLVFASDRRRLLQAVDSFASAIIAGEFAQQSNCSKPILITHNPKLAFARLASRLFSEEKREGHDESA